MNTSKTTISYLSPHELTGLDMHESVLLAYSGGSDSTALLHILQKDAEKRGYTLHLAHLDHEIRGEEAKRDAEFCRARAEKYGLPFHLCAIDVPALARESGRSLEAEAREQRYAFFERIMRENNIKILVTAHHAEDQIETILLHILRGSGISGLCGMREIRSFGEGSFLVRPLLQTEKADILRYLKENELSYVEDSTNSDTSYMRNALRADIVPALYRLQPDLSRAFSRLSSNAKDADDLIFAEADDFIFSECRHGYIPTEKLMQHFPAVEARILTELYKKHTDAALEQTHIASILELCARKPAYAELSLPDKLCAVIERGKLRFEKREAHHKNDKNTPPQGFSLPFAVGTYKTEHGVTVTIERMTQNNVNIKLDVNVNVNESGASTLCVSSRHLTESTVIRTRLPGDSIMLNNVHKKVKKLFCDAKLPPSTRERLPMLAEGNEILWIPSVAVCDSLNRDTLKSDEIYRITVKIENNKSL